MQKCNNVVRLTRTQQVTINTTYPHRPNSSNTSEPHANQNQQQLRSGRKIANVLHTNCLECNRRRFMIRKNVCMAKRRNSLMMAALRTVILFNSTSLST